MVRNIVTRTFKELDKMLLARHKDSAVMSIRRQNLRFFFFQFVRKNKSKLIALGKGILF